MEKEKKQVRIFELKLQIRRFLDELAYHENQAALAKKYVEKQVEELKRLQTETEEQLPPPPSAHKISKPKDEPAMPDTLLDVQKNSTAHKRFFVDWNPFRHHCKGLGWTIQQMCNEFWRQEANPKAYWLQFQELYDRPAPSFPKPT